MNPSLYDTCVTLAFYSGKGTNPVEARIVRALTGEYTHVEIIFNGREACSINQQTPVYFTNKKEFNRDEWEFLTILDIQAENVAKMRDFCIEQAKNESTFDFDATNRCLTPVPLRKPNSNKWFCSYLICTALQIGKVLPNNVIASATTPSSLYALLYKHVPKNRLIADSNPRYMSRLQRNAASVLDL